MLITGKGVRSQVIRLVLDQEHTSEKGERLCRCEYAEAVHHPTMLFYIRISAHLHKPVRDGKENECIVDKWCDDGDWQIRGRWQWCAIGRWTDVTSRHCPRDRSR